MGEGSVLKLRWGGDCFGAGGGGESFGSEECFEAPTPALGRAGPNGNNFGRSRFPVNLQQGLEAIGPIGLRSALTTKRHTKHAFMNRLYHRRHCLLYYTQ